MPSVVAPMWKKISKNQNSDFRLVGYQNLKKIPLMYKFYTYCCVPSSVNDWDNSFLKALLLFCLWKFLFCVVEVFELTKSISCSISRGLSSNSSSHSSIDLDLENSISSSTPEAVTTNVVIIYSFIQKSCYNLFKKKKFFVKPQHPWSEIILTQCVSYI